MISCNNSWPSQNAIHIHYRDVVNLSYSDLRPAVSVKRLHKRRFIGSGLTKGTRYDSAFVIAFSSLTSIRVFTQVVCLVFLSSLYSTGAYRQTCQGDPTSFESNSSHCYRPGASHLYVNIKLEGTTIFLRL